MHPAIERVQGAIQDLKAGKMVILTDHPDRENEGDLVFPAELITADIVNFMIRHCTGIICLPLKAEQLKKLGLDYMVAPHENTSSRGTPFTVSIEARDGVTTGVSAADRAKTIATAAREDVQAEELVKPGHIFPLHARDGGVLERAGHTEGSLDLVTLAGFKPAAVLCEIMNPDGSMARGESLKAFAEEHQLRILAIEDLITYRLSQENMIAEEATASLPLAQGTFEISVIREKRSGAEHIVLKSNKQTSPGEAPLVRIHSSCITGDLFGSLRCDCNRQLEYSLERLGREGGILIYLNQEGRGIGLFNKIKAYALQEQGADTVEANRQLGLPVDSRDYYLAANILRNLKFKRIRLLTNNPLKLSGLKKYGLEDIQQEPMPIFCDQHNLRYLSTKKEKLNHIINF